MKKIRETSSPSSSHRVSSRFRVSSPSPNPPSPPPHQHVQQTQQQIHGVQEQQQQQQDGGAPSPRGSPFADAPCASAEHVRNMREMYGRSTMFELLDNDDIPLHYLRSGMRLVFAYELTFRRHEDYAAMYLLTHSSSASGFGVPYFVSTGGDCAELEKRVSAALHVAGVFVNYACVRKDEVSRAFFLSLDVSISLSARRSLRLGLANLDDDAVACQRGRTWWDRLPRDEEKRLRDMQQDLGPCVIGHLAARTDTDKVLWSRGEIRYFFFRHK